MDPWRKLDERPAFTGEYRRVLSRTFERPDGRVARFEVKAEDDIVAVLALTADDRIVLVREFRVGPEEVLLELPGGIVDAGESPLEAAARELREETGFAGTVELVGRLVDCAYSTRSKHVAVATDCIRTHEPAPHGDELLEVVLVDLERFRGHLRSGRLTDVDVGYRALDHLGLL